MNEKKKEKISHFSPLFPFFVYIIQENVKEVKGEKENNVEKGREKGEEMGKTLSYFSLVSPH